MMVFDEGFISLNRLRFFARHGALEQERQTGGEFVVSVTVKTDFSKALLTDEVNDTVNYAVLQQIISDEMKQPSQLLEHVAGRIAKSICDKFNTIAELWVEIEKLNPPLQVACQSASVRLHVKNH